MPVCELLDVPDCVLLVVWELLAVPVLELLAELVPVREVVAACEGVLVVVDAGVADLEMETVAVEVIVADAVGVTLWEMDPVEVGEGLTMAVHTGEATGWLQVGSTGGAEAKEAGMLCRAPLAGPPLQTTWPMLLMPQTPVAAGPEASAMGTSPAGSPKVPKGATQAGSLTSKPAAAAPEHTTVPLARRKQEMEAPSARATTLARAAKPSGSTACPASEAPQQVGVPPATSMQLWALPPATARAPLTPAGSAAAPAPDPQQVTLPLAALAQQCAVPQAMPCSGEAKESGGLACPAWLRPQQRTWVRLLITAQACSVPTLSAAAAPATCRSLGTSIWPAELLPQQYTAEAWLRAQVKRAPAPMARMPQLAAVGTVVSPAPASSPQHTTRPQSSMAHACAAPTATRAPSAAAHARPAALGSGELEGVREGVMERLREGVTPGVSEGEGSSEGVHEGVAGRLGEAVAAAVRVRVTADVEEPVAVVVGVEDSAFEGDASIFEES